MLFAAIWHRKKLDGQNYNPDELAFMPAALEIQETPPSPIGRLLMWALLALFSLGVAWAAMGEVDIVAVAHGKIIPTGKSKVIQPLEAGTITKILVEEGQSVKQGDILIELDMTTYQADSAQVESELMTANIRLLRVQALLVATQENSLLTHPRTYFTPPDNLNPEQVRTQRALLESQWQELQSRLRSIDDAIRQQTSERSAVSQEVRKIKQQLPIIIQRANNHKVLMEKQLVAKDSWLVLEQERIEQVQNLAAAQHRYKQVSAGIDGNHSEKRTLIAEFKKQQHNEQSELEMQIASMSQEQIKTNERAQRQTLTAPVDGVVQQLVINTIGGIVTPAQELMVIVPIAQQLEVEAWLENKDMGFVSQGQTAEIKVDAFPFTKYGTIDAKIKTLTHDAIEDEQLGWVFATRVLMDKTTMLVNGNQVSLTPGMSVAVEIKTGKRRLLEYFLAPLLRYKQESVRERSIVVFLPNYN